MTFSFSEPLNSLLAQWDNPMMRVAWALLIGIIVGIEREISQRTAGLRTHVLVCMGAAIFTLISIHIAPQGLMPGVTQTGDPARIAAQVVSGIGFIGGGAVLRHGANIRGLTTAASLWMMASIGMLAGLGDYALSLMAALTTVGVLFIFGRLERNLLGKHTKGFQILAKIAVPRDAVENTMSWFEQRFGDSALEISTSESIDSQVSHVRCLLESQPARALTVHSVVRQLESLDDVQSVSVAVVRPQE
jgi:putative Mg2+ transporter-C (MgtC) family protein